MRRNRAARALVLIVLACLVAVPALAVAPAEREAGPAPVERPGWTERVRDAVISLWARLVLVIAPDDETEGDRTPGSGLDPDGHKPPVE